MSRINSRYVLNIEGKLSFKVQRALWKKFKCMRIIDLTLDRKYHAILVYTYTDTYVSSVLIYGGREASGNYVIYNCEHYFS